MKNFLNIRSIGIWVALVALVLDVLSKEVALKFISGIHPVVEGFFNLRLAYNYGVSFSMLGEGVVMHQHIILGVFAFIMAGVFMVWMARNQEATKLFQPALGLVIGGAIGNGIDRFRHGAVVDFLDFYYNTYHWPTFNIADTAICIGVGLLLLDAFLSRKKEKGNEK